MTQLVGHAAPGLAGRHAVGLVEGLTDRGSDDGVLAAGDMREGIPHPVNAAALPSGLEHPLYRGSEAAVRIADDQLGSIEPASLQSPQEAHPECLSL